MWNNLSPQQQQFLMATLMGQQQSGMGWGIGNPLMTQQTGGNWFDWLNSGPGQSAGAMPQAPQGTPPAWSQMPQWMQQGQQPSWLSGFLNQPTEGAPQMPWMQQQAAQNYAQQAALAQTQQTGYLPAQQWGQQQMAPQAQPSQELTNGLGQQRLPDYSGGGPSYSPYAMPGTVQYNPNG